ncbi:GDP-mannose 4,6-dehydratase [Patescibacteria group bacterium]
MRILVTGISGFVGPYLKKALEQKNNTVIGLDRQGNGKDVYKVDILDSKTLNKIFIKLQPEAIIHLAGFSSVKESWEKPELTKAINVDGTKNILSAAEKLKHQPKLLIIGSAEIYGTPEYTPIDEKHPPHPQSPYAESRFEQEKISLSSSLPVIIARSFNHTGPGQMDKAALPSFAKKIVNIELGHDSSPMLVGNVSVQRDFTDVRDVVEAYYLLLQHGQTGEVYNVCSGRSYELKSLLEYLITQSTTKIDYKIDEKLSRPNDIPVLKGDYTKINNLCGWEPKIKINKTLDDILNYWRSHE